MRKYIVLAIMALWGSYVQGETIHIPADQPTIQAGIDAAVDGDTVLAALDMRMYLPARHTEPNSEKVA